MSQHDSTPRHPIRVAAKRAGLTPATLRAWERRYQAVDPGRSDAGQRLYSDRDVERLRTLRALTEVGRPISMVAEMSTESATELLLQDRAAIGAPSLEAAAPGPAVPDDLVDEAFRQVVSMDPDGLERTLWRSTMTLGGAGFLSGVLGPLLVRIGEGWVAGEVTPGQEHLATGVVERILARLTDAAGPSSGPGMVVATLPGERHGLGARLVAAAAVLEGWSVTYLGTDLPESDIAAAASGVGARAVAISVVQDRSGTSAGSLRVLRELMDPSILLVVGGGGAALLDPAALPEGVRILDGLAGLRSLAPAGARG
jgi:DNA-binding transcriptional MerR regulator/methylmalonyl-CoA mutase cobalamin-binding subunit